MILERNIKRKEMEEIIGKHLKKTYEIKDYAPEHRNRLKSLQ